MVQMSIFLLLAGDIDIEMFGLTETHIWVNDTPSFLNDLTPHGYALFHRPRHENTGGGEGFLIKRILTV